MREVEAVTRWGSRPSADDDDGATTSSDDVPPPELREAIAAHAAKMPARARPSHTK